RKPCPHEPSRVGASSGACRMTDVWVTRFNVQVSFEALSPRAKAYMQKKASPTELPTGAAADFIAELVCCGFDVRSDESKDVPVRPRRRPELRLVPSAVEPPARHMLRELREHRERPARPRPTGTQLGLFT